MQPVTNEIKAPIQCAHCLKESAQNAYELRSQLILGYTSKGFQVWCTKHQVSVIYLTSEELADKVNRVWEGYS